MNFNRLTSFTTLSLKSLEKNQTKELIYKTKINIIKSWLKLKNIDKE
jgi:hypothetical protein